MVPDHRLAPGRRLGPSGAILVLALVGAALGAVLLRAEAGRGFSLSDWAAVRFSVLQALLSASFSVGLAIPVAAALARRKFRGRSLLVTLLGAPFILPVIVAVFGLLTVFGRAGWVNSGLAAVGLPGVSIYGLQGVVLAHVFFNLPLATRLILQGWQTIPAERFRLAAQLNLTPRALRRTLAWPVIRQTAPGAFALIFVICLTSFAVALTLGGGPRATTIELAIYEAFRLDFDLGRAAKLSLVQLGVAGLAGLVALRLLPGATLGGGMGRPAQSWDARGGLSGAVDVIWIFVAAAFLLLPLAAVIQRGVQGLAALPPSVWPALANSMIVALTGIVLTLALAVPMAGWIAARARGGIEAVGLLGLSTSPLLIGTGWFILIHPVADPFLFALPVTAAVNMLMALPFVLRILIPALRDTLETHGRLIQSLGIRGLSLWWLILLPSLRRQLGFAAGLTGAMSIGDLGVIALFADPGRETLPLLMVRLMGAYRMDAAAGVALMLLVLAFGVFWICDWGGRRNAES